MIPQLATLFTQIRQASWVGLVPVLLGLTLGGCARSTTDHAPDAPRPATVTLATPIQQQPETPSAQPLPTSAGALPPSGFADAAMTAMPPATPDAAVLAGTADDLIPPEVGAWNGDQATRTRLVQRDGKYPLRRIEEVLTRTPGGVIVSRSLEMVADHFLVRVRPGAGKVEQTLAEAGCAVRRQIPRSDLVLASFPYLRHADYPRIRAELQRQAAVDVVDNDWVVHATITPDDPQFNLTWGLHNTGQTGGQTDADIDAPEAWSTTTGSRDVVVGIIDTGIDLTNPDLAANLWSNPGESGLDGGGRDKRTNGIDDDGNGYVDDWRGWNFVANTNLPQDDHFHGTHVAGTIGAVGGDGQGVAGVCWQVSLVGLKFLDANGSGMTTDAVEAVLYANGLSLPITNNSWGGGGFSQVLLDAIVAGQVKNHLFIAAAGNDGWDLNITPSYPASYNAANIVTVAASDHNDLRASFSNYGTAATGVDLAAPGASIRSCFPTVATPAMAAQGLTAGYGTISGTSMATPHVSGVAALYRSVAPTADWATTRNRILAACDSAAIPGVPGGRRLNAARVVDASWTPPATVLFVADVVLTESLAQDRFANPGEILSLKPAIFNGGGTVAGAVTVRIAAAPGLSILTSTTAVGSIDAGGTASPAEALRVQAPADAPDGAEYTVDLVAESPDAPAASQTWRIRVFVPQPVAYVQPTWVTGQMVAQPLANRVYLADLSGPSVRALSTTTGIVEARAPLSGAPILPNATGVIPGTWCSDLSISRDGTILYVPIPAAQRIDRFQLPELVPLAPLPTTVQVSGVIEAANGELLISDLSAYGGIKRINRTTGALLGTVSGLSYIYKAAELESPDQGATIFVVERGLYTSGGPGYVTRLDGASLAITGTYPFNMVYVSQFACGSPSAAYVTNGGVYGLTRLDLTNRTYTTWYPGGTVSYGIGCVSLFNSGSAWSANGGSVLTVSRWSDTGTRLAEYRIGGNAKSMRNGAMAITSNGVVVVGTTTGVLAVGRSSLQVDTAPNAKFSATVAADALPATVTCDASASSDPQGAAVVTYSWNWGDGTTDTSTSPTASHTYAAHGSYGVSLVVTNATGWTGSARQVVEVYPRPVLSAPGIVTAEDTDVVIPVTASDPLGLPLSFSVQTPPAHGTLLGSGPTWTYRPTLNVHGSDAIVVTASNGLVSSLPLAISITITPVNDAPVLVVPPVTTVLAGSSVVISLTASDPEGDALVWETQPPTIGTVSGTGPSFTYTAPADGSGTASFQVRVGDGNLWSSMATVPLIISHTPISGGDWPTQGGNNQRTGTTTTPVGALNLEWQQPLTWTPHPIAIGGGRIILSSGTYNSSTLTYLKIGSWDLGSGTPLWTKDVSAAYLSAPAAGPQTAYVQSCQSGARLVTAYNSATGSTVFAQPWGGQWEYYGGPIMTGSALVSGGGTYGGLYRWNADTGAQEWFRSLAQVYGHTPALSEDGEHIYAVAGNVVTSTNATTGAAEWSLTLPHSTAMDCGGAAPVVAGNRLVFHVPYYGSGYLDCVDLTSRTLVWTKPVGTTIGSPAVDAATGRVYARTSTALKCYDLTTGTVLATSVTLDAGLARSQPIIASDGIVAAGSTKTWILHPTTLGTLATITGGGQVAIASNRLIIAGTSGLACYATGPSQRPVAIPQNLTVVEDTATAITLTGTDPQNDPLTFNIVTQPTRGVLTGVPPALVYTPSANYTGTDSFSFTAADVGGAGVPATVALTITPVNDRPVTNPIACTLFPGRSSTITLSGSDVDSVGLTWRLVTLPVHVSATLSGNQVTLTPAAGFTGGDTMTVACHDGQLESEPNTVTITVAALAPGKILSELATPSGGYGQSVDVAGDYLVVGAPSHQYSGRAYVYRRAVGGWILDGILTPSQVGNDRFGTSVAISGTTVAVGSCDAASSWARATIFTRSPAGAWTEQGEARVTATAQAVVSQEDAWSIAQGAWVDLDGDQLVVGSPFDGTGSVSVFRRNAGVWTLETELAKPANAQRWGWSVAIRGDTVLAGAHRTSNGAVDAGIAAISTRTAGVWSAPTVLASSAPAAYDWFGFSVALADGMAVIGAPQAGDGGTKRGLVYVFGRDGAGWSQLQCISNPSGPADANDDQFGKAVATDGVRLLASAPYHYQNGIGTTGAVHRLERSSGTWQAVDRWVAVDASNGDWASEAVAVDVHHAVVGVPLDDDLGANTGAVYVIPYNRAPADLALALTTVEDTAVDHVLAPVDPDGDPLQVTLTATGSLGTATLDGLTVHYQPAPDATGVDQITCTITDGFGGTAAGTIAITITPVNDPPTCADGSLDLAWNTAGSVHLVGSDPDGTTPTFRIVTGPLHGTATISGDLLTYTPALGWSGSDSMAVVAEDGELVSASATVAVTVAGPPWDAELRNGVATTLTLVASVPQAIETGTLGRATLIRSGPVDADLLVDLVYSGTAGNGTDIRPIPGQITMPAGQSSVDIEIEPLQDGIAEVNETAILTIAPGSGYTLISGTSQRASIAVLDDEPVTVHVSASDATMAEPADHGRFTITRTGAPTTALTVLLATSGTATPGTDVVALPTSVVIPAGAQQVDLPVTLLDDNEAEERETVILAVLPDAGYVVGTQATAAIADNEPETISIEALAPFAAEPGIAGTFRVVRRGTAVAARTVTYVVSGTATPGSDYNALSGNITLTSTSSAVNLTFIPTNDTLVEGVETVVVTLAPPAGAGLGIATASVGILDNDSSALPVVSLKAGVAAASEPATDGTLIISRTGSTAAPLRVLLQAPTTVAVAGLDYAALPTVVDIPAGHASLTLLVDVLDDQVAEATESVSLTLAPSADYSISTTRTGTVTITDDEAPSVTLSVADAIATEPGVDTARWTIQRTGALGQALTVRYAVAGTAIAGTDYVALPMSVTIPAGSSVATVTLTALDDAGAEADEQAILRLLPDAAYTLGGAASGLVTIKDNEAPVLDLTALDASATEGGDTAKFRITRRGTLSPAVSVAVSWSGTAQNGVDISSLPASITLAANAATADLTVTTKNDTVAEEVETVIGTLQPGAGYTVGQAEATVQIIDDESTGRVAIRVVNQSGYEYDAQPTAFEIFRTGRLTAPITVTYTIAGTALVHELNPPRQVVLPAGVDRMRIALTPLRDDRTESDETVILRLVPGPGYTLGTAVEATFTIQESPPGSG